MQQIIIDKIANYAHSLLMAKRENEPLDGDEVEEFTNQLANKLNKLNANT